MGSAYSVPLNRSGSIYIPLGIRLELLFQNLDKLYLEDRLNTLLDLPVHCNNLEHRVMDPSGHLEDSMCRQDMPTFDQMDSKSPLDILLPQ